MYPAVLVTTFLLFTFSSARTPSITCPVNGKPRVRREWRTLSPDIRDRVFNAYWVMRNLSTTQGREKFGNNFISYADLVVSHACANLDPRCDQAHFGPVFSIFHRAMLLQFENALLAIDPEIEAMPYWNVAYDSQGGKFRNDPENHIFTENYFGSVRGQPKNAFGLVDGKLAHFPAVEFDPMQHTSASGSQFRCIQEEWLKVPTNSICRRCCGKTKCKCDRDDDIFDTFLRTFPECSPSTVRNYEEFPIMDGTRDFVFTDKDFNTCTNASLIRSFDQWQRCIELERSSCFFPNVDVSELPGDINIKLKTLSYLATENQTCGQQGYYYDPETRARVELNAHHSQIHFKLAGDMKDPATSPNDPIFFSYHADIDRNAMTWQANTAYLEDVWWKYPFDQTPPPNTNAAFSGPFNIYHLMQCGLIAPDRHPEYTPFALAWVPGTLLDDVVNSGYPIRNIFGETCTTPPYTVRDIIEKTTPKTTPYTYDTLEHLYDSCSPREPTCN